jgi:hypothetical protein
VSRLTPRSKCKRLKTRQLESALFVPFHETEGRYPAQQIEQRRVSEIKFMTNKMKSAFLSLLGAGLVWLAPMAKADEWDKRTIVTFNQPVEIPGRVLPAGTYVFKLADSESDRNIVQVFTEDELKPLATVLAIPDSRMEPTDRW